MYNLCYTRKLNFAQEYKTGMSDLSETARNTHKMSASSKGKKPAH